MQTSKLNTEKPVILQVLPELNSGGVERGVVEISKALIENDFTSCVASNGGRLVNKLPKENIHFTLPLASKNPITIYRNISKLKKIIKEHNVDIIHARSRAPAWSAYFAAKAMNINFVTTFHGMYSFKNKLKKKYNSVMTKSDNIIAVSDYVKKHIMDNYDINENNIHTIHRGVDIEQFNMKNINEQRIIDMIKSLNLDTEKHVILMPARMSRWKGHDFLIEALRFVESNNYVCLFVGNDDKNLNFRKKLDKKIYEYKLNDRVRFIDNVMDMPALYAVSDIVISASTRPESFGRIAIESQAMERLLIATNHGGSCETIIDKKTGWLVEPGDEIQLANLIDKALNLTIKNRSNITSKAKKHIESNFSLESMTKKTLDIYNNILIRCGQ